MQIPTNCPSCDSTLERVKDQLFCRSTSCPAQNSKVVEGFCKKMKIKGFGSKTIEKLELSSIFDLYNLQHSDIATALSDKMADKLMTEIDAKRKVDFGTFIGALGIPLIGNVAGNKIGTIAGSWDALDELTVGQLKEIGIGEKARQSLTAWMNTELGEETMEIPLEFNELQVRASQDAANPSEPKGDVVVTGKLNDFKNRGEAVLFLEQHGYTVKSGVTKKTIAVICEDDSSSSKITKARDNGIPILTIKELLSGE